MPLNYLSAQHFAEQDGGFEPQRQTNGLLVIPGVSNWFFGANDAITFSLLRFDTPTLRAGRIALQWNGQTRYVVGNVAYDEIEVTVRDMVDKNVFASLLDWQYQVHNSWAADRGALPGLGGSLPRHARGLARDYKKTGIVFLFGPSGINGRSLLAKVFVIQGVFPTSVESNGIDYDSEDLLELDVTLSVDSAMLAYPIMNVAGLGALPEIVVTALSAASESGATVGELAELAALVLGGIYTSTLVSAVIG